MWAIHHTALVRGAPPRRAVGIRRPAHFAGMPPKPRTDRAPASLRRRFLRSRLALLAAALLMAPAIAADIPVTSASLRVEAGAVPLSEEFDVTLTPAHEQAHDNDIPLYYTIDFELEQTR